MRLHPRILVITFVESFATILIERGIYFYAEEVFGFGAAANLALALLFGGTYVVGALASHRICTRLGERRVLLGAIGLMLLSHALLAAAAAPATILVGNAVLGFLNGLRWPVVESYVGAGHTPISAGAVVGRFNIAWASAVPISLAVAGPVIGAWSPGLFVLAGALNAASLALAWRVPPRPTHLPHDHPERPDARGLAAYRSLLSAARWLMLASYSLLWILGAVMPIVFQRDHRVPIGWAPAAAALLDVFRLSAFVLLAAWTGWRRRRWPLAAAVVVLPISFLAVRYGNSLPVVLASEAAFGLAMGAVYYAALYYAMVVRNAAVDAGGVHEGLIGGGFVLGPVLGLAAEGLAGGRGATGGAAPAEMLLAIGPLIALSAVGALRAMARKP